MNFDSKYMGVLHNMVLQYNKSLVIDKYGIQVMSLEGKDDSPIYVADTIEGMVQNLPYQHEVEDDEGVAIGELELNIEELALVSPDLYYPFAIEMLRSYYNVKLLLGEHKIYKELNDVLVQLDDTANIEISIDFVQGLEPTFDVTIPDEFAVQVDNEWIGLFRADEITGDALLSFYTDRGISDIDTSSIYGAIIVNAFKDSFKFEGDTYSLADVINDILENLNNIIPITLKLESDEVIIRSRAMQDGLLFNEFGDMLNGDE
jgi:hypothetical protein